MLRIQVFARIRWLVLVVLALVVSLNCAFFTFSSRSSVAVAAGPSSARPLTLLTTITIPGAPKSNWFRDVATTSQGNYYLTDASNNQVDEVAIAQSQFERSIGHGLFNGPGNSANFDFARQSPEGILAYQGKLWVSNVHVDSSGTGHSQILVFDQKSGAQLATIDTKGQQRSDEMTIMPNLGLLVVTNPDETFDNPPEIPWVNFIQMSTYQLVAQLPFPNGSPGATGLQQPEWIGGNQVLIDVPSPIGNPNGGELDTIVVQASGNNTYHPFVPSGAAGHHTFPKGVNCQPAGLSLNVQTGMAAVGCGYFAQTGTPGSQIIWNLRTNTVQAVLPGIQGVDIVATTSHGLFLYPSYITNVMYVADAQGNVLQKISTSDGAHTVTFDPDTGEVFVPTGGGVVAVYSTR